MDNGDELTRIGISLPDSLLLQFDDIIARRGYTSRSEGIRDVIRSYNTCYPWHSDGSEKRSGVITLVYPDSSPAILEAVDEITSRNQALIRSSLRKPIPRRRQVEVLLVRGEGPAIRDLAERLMAVKGIESVKVTAIAVDK